MASGECCGTCRFYQSRDDRHPDQAAQATRSGDFYYDGVCRAHPPRLGTFAADWCGEFERPAAPQ
jgi:hypothetical protein